MHPIMAEYTANDLRARQLARASARRRLDRSPGARRPGWRGRQAARLVALARRLDPSLDVRQLATR